jgi:hypothetical protein
MFKAATSPAIVQVSIPTVAYTLCILRIDEYCVAVELSRLLSVQEEVPPGTTVMTLSDTAPKYFVRLAVPDERSAWLGIAGVGDVVEVPHHALRRVPPVLETLQPRPSLLAFALLNGAWLPILDIAQLGSITQEV